MELDYKIKILTNTSLLLILSLILVQPMVYIQNSTDISKILKPISYYTKHERTKKSECQLEVEQYSTESRSKNTSLEGYKSLLNEECEWLRELIRRRIWISFEMRFSDMRTQIIGRGEIALKRADLDLISEWTKTLKENAITHGFAQLCVLCYKLVQSDLIPLKTLRVLSRMLKFHDRHMADQHWAVHYWDDLTSGRHGEIVPLLHETFSDITESWLHDEWSGEEISYAFSRLEEMQQEFVEPDIKFEESEEMTYK